MPATPESKARTRAFARVIGPFLIYRSLGHHRGARAGNGRVPVCIFENEALVWIMGSLLLFGWAFDHCAPPILVERIR